MSLPAWEAYVPSRARQAQSSERRWQRFMSNHRVQVTRLYVPSLNPSSAFNEALSLIGVPLIRGVTQTNAQAQETAIAISDLQVKVAQIDQEKRKLAEALREQLVLEVLEVLEFDATRRESQISQEIARRAAIQHRLVEQ